MHIWHIYSPRQLILLRSYWGNELVMKREAVDKILGSAMTYTEDA